MRFQHQSAAVFEHISLIAAMVLFSALIISCGGNTGSTPDDSYRTREPAKTTGAPGDVYDANACDPNLTPDNGPQALFANSTRPKIVQSFYFEKKYNRAHLEAVLDASANSSAEYIQSLGVSVNKAPDTKTNACKTYFALPTASGIADAHWSRINNSGEGFLQGIFFDACGAGTVACREREVVRPTIVVSETADRWAIIHEMMHFNFNLTRKEDRSRPSQIQVEARLTAALQSIKASMNSYSIRANEKDLNDAIKQIKEIFDFMRDELAITTWEDIAIEGTLIDELTHGRLTHVMKRSAADTAWYMAASRAAGLQRYKPLSVLLSAIKREGHTHDWSKVSTGVDEANLKIAALEQETLGLVKDAYVKVAEMQGESVDSAWPDSPEMRVMSAAMAYMDPHIASLDRSSKRLNEIESAIRVSTYLLLKSRANSLPAHAR